MVEPTTVAIPIDEVILLEDRAHVLRRATLTLPAGRSRLRVGDVTPVLVDRTLCASLSQAGRDVPDADASAPAERVTDVRLRRRARAFAADLPEQVRAHQLLRRELGEKLRERHSRMQRLQLQETELARIADAALEDVAIDAAWEQLDTVAWRTELQRITEDERTVRDARVALGHEIEDLERDHDDLQLRIEVAASPSDEVAAELHLEVLVAEPGEYTVRVDYLVPGACWRPYHRASLEGEGEGTAVTFATDGCVWQNTGEDWDDVQLVFSTERPSLGTEPPLLASDILAVQRRREVLEVETRQQEIQTTGLGEGRRATAPELPGIDDGGEVLALRPSTRAAVPSDGRPLRVLLSSFTAGAQAELVVLPELAAAVLRKSVQVNAAAAPILAGPVDLVHHGGFAGRTSVKFIAPSERFALGWGPDGALRVRREVEHSAEDKGMLSSWIKQDTTVTVRLSNLGEDARSLVVRERIPVSEIEKVQITVDGKKTSGGKNPDGDGIVEWSVDLEGYGRRKLVLVYEVKKHTDVVGV